MSGEVKFSRIPAWAAAVDLTESDWRVLHALCLHCDKAGRAYPSLARIAQIARMHRNHVSRSTKRLEQFGLIRTKRLRRGEGWANTHYEVVYDTPVGMAPDTVAPDSDMAPVVVTPEEQVAPEPVAYGTCGGSTDGTCGGALTYQLTDQGTEAYQEEEEQRVEVKAAGGTSVGSNPICCWPLGQGCERPALAGSRFCGAHGA